jgi:hypothetical protein
MAPANEAQQVSDAIANANGFVVSQVKSLPRTIATDTYNGLKGMVTGPVTAPLYGGYTLLTGKTLDGQRATTFENVMAGMDVLLGAAAVLSAAYPRIAAYLQAAEASEVRAAAQGKALLNVPGLTELTEANGGANVRSLFQQALATPAFMDIPGAVQALNELASGSPNKITGAAFAIRSILAELATGEVRLVEDWLAGKQAADVVRRNGDVVQYKSYGRKSPSKLWDDIMKQGETDVRRYATNGWKDHLGGKAERQFRIPLRRPEVARRRRAPGEDRPVRRGSLEVALLPAQWGEPRPVRHAGRVDHLQGRRPEISGGAWGWYHQL